MIVEIKLFSQSLEPRRGGMIVKLKFHDGMNPITNYELRIMRS